MNKSERRIQAYLSGLDVGLVSIDPELKEIADLRARLRQPVLAPSMAARIQAEERMLTALADRDAHAQQRRRTPFFAALPKAVLTALGLFALSGTAMTASAAVGGPDVPAALFAAVGIEMPEVLHLDFGLSADTAKDPEAGQPHTIAATVTPTPARTDQPLNPTDLAEAPSSVRAASATAPPSTNAASATSTSDAPPGTDSDSTNEPDSESVAAPTAEPLPAPVPAPAPEEELPGQDGKEQGRGNGQSRR